MTTTMAMAQRATSQQDMTTMATGDDDGDDGDGDGATGERTNKQTNNKRTNE